MAFTPQIETTESATNEHLNNVLEMHEPQTTIQLLNLDTRTNSVGPAEQFLKTTQ